MRAPEVAPKDCRGRRQGGCRKPLEGIAQDCSSFGRLGRPYCILSPPFVAWRAWGVTLHQSSCKGLGGAAIIHGAGESARGRSKGLQRTTAGRVPEASRRNCSRLQLVREAWSSTVLAVTSVCLEGLGSDASRLKALARSWEGLLLHGAGESARGRSKGLQRTTAGRVPEASRRNCSRLQLVQEA